MACNANEHIYHFFFDNIDRAYRFVEEITILLNSGGTVSLTTLNALAGIKHGNVIYNMNVKWSIDDLEGTHWRCPELDGDNYVITLPEPGISPKYKKSSVQPKGVKDVQMTGNIESPEPITITINTSEIGERRFFEVYHEVIKAANEIKDRFVTINII